MDFHDFPRFLGKSGAVLKQPPKICASLISRHPEQPEGAESDGWQGDGERSSATIQSLPTEIYFWTHVKLKCAY